MLALLLACSSPAECPACPACEACDEPGVALEPWEEELLGPVLDELRAGIVLHGDEPFGVCRGASGCDEFLGQDVGDLPEGDFLLRAELKAPAVGEGWTVDFRVDCTTTTGATRSSTPARPTATGCSPSGRSSPRTPAAPATAPTA